MNFHRLLKKQIKKFLPEALQQHPDLEKFLLAVNDSYVACERDAALADRAFRISEEEYIEINKKLQHEAAVKKQSIEKLKETIGTITGDEKSNNTDDLLMIARYLNQQVNRRKSAEQVFTSLITNMQSGVLLEDETRHIVFTNQQFCDTFGITAPPLALQGADCSASAEQSKFLFKYPEKFVAGINTILQQQKLVAAEPIEFADGRIFERDYIPIFVDEKYKGHFWSYRDISERKKAEADLKSSQELWQFALEGAGDGVWEYDFETQDVFFSRQYKKMLGYNDEEFKNDPNEWLSRVHPRDITIIEQTDKDYYENRITSHQREYRIKHKNGDYLWILDRGMIVNHTASGQPKRIIGTHTDITARKKAEEEYKRISVVASANENGVVFTDALGKISWSNEGFSKITGFAQEEIIGQTPLELCEGPLSQGDALLNMVSAFFEGRSFNVELIHYRKDKTTFWGRVTGQALTNNEGKVEQYFAIIENISEEKEVERKLKQYDERLKLALTNVGDNYWEHNFLTGKTFFSSDIYHLLGFTSEEYNDVATLWWDRIHPADKKILADNDSKYKQGSIDHHTNEYRVIHKDGKVRWVYDRGVVTEKDANGKPLTIIGTHIDITERKLSEQAIKIREEKYRSIIANMNLGLLEVDNQEKIQFANQSFCDMSGYALKELLGKKASTLFAKGENEEFIEMKNEMRKKGISDAYEISLKNKKGEPKWWLVSGAPRYNDNGDLVGSIGIHLDITQQKILELELVDAREQAESSVNAKQTFLANMSHEIRTPMNAILGMTNQLGKTKLNKDQHFYLNTIHSAADNLLIIINDILDLSKIDAGKLTLEKIGFEPKRVIDRVMQVMVHRAEEKGLNFINSSCDYKLSPILMGDPYRLNQVLLNLVSNAIKFTHKGTIDINCRVLTDTVLKQTVQITVTDTGIGMDESFAKNLFDKFSQEDSSIIRKYGGTGLGMSISKELVDLMHGRIEVVSKKGEGTSISVIIEFDKGNITDLPFKEMVATDTSLLQGKKILVTDDNEMNQLVAATILQNFGAAITAAFNGAEAIEKIKETAFDIVLMDVQMPVMDGIEATKIIRETISTTLPIIALTAFAINGDNQKCIAAGMNDYLSKPFEESQLLNIISKWLGKSLQNEKNRPEITGKEDVLYDLSKLNEIARGNKIFVDKMINLFIEQIPVSVEEIQAAYLEKNFGAIKRVAHRIKPSIDNMGIAALKTEVREIEALAQENQNSPKLIQLIQQMDNTLKKVVEELHKELV
ncbi:PAS domain-containing hybrid sensor histidine kinase/response regulator [Ferruginibacter profundus]